MSGTKQSALTQEMQIKLRSSIQACKTRTVLTLEQAAEIFKIHLRNQSFKTESRSSTQVAFTFGVCEKTVRDIWTGRTWFHELIHLDPTRAALAEQRMRPPGRPRFDRRDAGDCLAVPSGYVDLDSIILKRPRLVSPAPSSPFLAFISSASAVVEPAGYSTAANSKSDIEDARLLEHGWFHHCKESHLSMSNGQQLHAGNGSFRSSVIWINELWGGCLAMEAAPLPASSSADDPFHDDWGDWTA